MGAYFDNQDLWFELLQHGDSDSPEWLRELTKDELSFDGAVRVLSNHGLVEVATSSQESTESKGYSIHGCVHSWTIHALNQKWDYDLARLAVKFVAAHVPGDKDIQPLLLQRRLLQHAARCSHMFSKSLVRDDELADVPASAARLRESMGSGLHVDALHGQQPSEPLCRPGQASRGRADVPRQAGRGRADVPASAARLRESNQSRSYLHLRPSTNHHLQSRSSLRT